MELTKEVFEKILDQKLDQKLDEKLKKFATKEDLKNFITKDDLKSFATKDDLKSFATKDDLKNFPNRQDLSTAILSSEKRIVARIDEAQEELARMVKNGFDDVLERLDVRQRVERLETDMSKIKNSLLIN